MFLVQTNNGRTYVLQILVEPMLERSGNYREPTEPA
jgi:hypothetical protein